MPLVTFFHPTTRACVVLLFALLLGGCGFATNGPSSANTPEEMFAAVLARPVPSGVAELQGVGDTWQGYNVFLRFRAPQDVVSALAGPPYSATPCNAALSRLALPKGYDRFAPAWEPDGHAGAVCYTASGVANTWTGSGQHYFLFDPVTQMVYFHGVGA